MGRFREKKDVDSQDIIMIVMGISGKILNELNFIKFILEFPCRKLK